MPKIPRELSPLEVGRIRTEGAHAVGGVPGLYLQVLGGSRSWVLRFVVGARRRRMGLGSFRSVTLSQAKEKARAAHREIDQGQDPIQGRQLQVRRADAARAKALTFRKACELMIAGREAEWRSSKHRQQWENTLVTYAGPILGSMDVATIETSHIMNVLDPIWRTKTETAARVRGRIEQVLDWAKVQGHRAGENPARWRGHLDHLLPKPSKIAKVRHHPAVSVEDAPAIVARIADAEGMGALALLFQVLTATRSGEVRGARWDEIDLDERLWTIPAERMKAAREHRVPLSRQAVALLEAQPSIDGCDLVFPGMKLTRMLSDMSLTAVMRRMQLGAVPHGFRSTFRDWASEKTSHPGEVVEMALAHAIEDKTEAAYRRGDLLVKRVALMQDWADYCRPMPSPAAG
ncbi:site-specific integrase [Verminephrobacter aporrectodeae subsp. tuberculatae]|uniref:tyrosine-type recombinase/integrase n=1 Tax=Verminephrobacter aporrectodeae TaxID=1110389 RepID=UPI0022443E1A|nr:site-specific integrase [Verminephrobacter aporrectodeae]MCW8207661.1 site-specific integrase [Verminephrobacter aporrectodeae subsp. tuberculatae]